MNQNKKKTLIGVTCVLSALLATVLLLTFAGPYAVLAFSRQEKPAAEYAYSESFCTDYEQTRAQLAKRVQALRQAGVTVETSEHAIDAEDGLYIDKVYLPAAEQSTNLIVLTTGVHGMEGYIGAVMLEVFFEEIYPTLDIADTGILIVANVNPYGMKYLRRYNENNVDLNRNFIEDWENFDLSCNKEYPKVDKFLQPKGKIGNAFWHEVGFYASLAKEAVFSGADTISDALLTGQYEYAEGVYYGGTEDQASTKYLKGVFAEALDGAYENIVHVDIHSGYGPRYNMVIFNSVQDPTTEEQTKAELGYDYVIATDSEAFYETFGDTTDYFYRLAKSKNTDKSLYSTCFEFGTIGDGFFDSILSLKYTVDENRLHQYGSKNDVAAEMVMENYKELYYPTEKEWREKTVADFKDAMTGVLNAKLK